MAGTLDDLSDVRALLDQHAALRLTPTAAGTPRAALSAALHSPALGAAGAFSPPTARELSFAAALQATQARPSRAVKQRNAPAPRVPLLSGALLTLLSFCAGWR